MLLLSVSEFRSNIAKYLKMAMTERIAIKSPAGIFDITPSQDIRVNPSPSGDNYFENEVNIRDVERGLMESRDGRYTTYDSEEKLKLMMGL